MLLRALVSLAVTAGLGAVPALAESDMTMFSDSGVNGAPYREISQGLEQLAARSGGWATVHDYGQSVGGQTLRLVKIQNPSAAKGTVHPAVLISGATHGNEYLGIEERLPVWFVDNRDGSPGLMRFLAAGGVIYVIPIVNPDGYERDSRENNNGVDLNRDFDLIPAQEPKFSQPESKALGQWLEQDLAASDLKMKLTVDYHCCNGSLLFPWSWTEEQLGETEYAAHMDVARLMQQDIDPSYSYGSTSVVLGYLGRGTSKDYYYAKYDALAFTFEGDYHGEGARFSKHTVWWDHILAKLAD